MPLNMFGMLTFLSALFGSPAAPQFLELPSDATIPLTNKSLSDIDPRITYRIQNTDNKIRGIDFNIATIWTAVQLSERSHPSAVIVNSEFRYREYAECSMKIFSSPKSPKQLTAQLAVHFLFVGLLAASKQPNFYETLLQILLNGEDMGSIWWTKSGNNDWKAELDQLSPTAALALEPGNLQLLYKNTTDVLASGSNSSNSESFSVQSRPSSSVRLNSPRVFLILLEAINEVFNHQGLRPSRIWNVGSVTLAATVCINPLGRHVMPYLTPAYAIRTLGRIAVYYTKVPGWYESVSETRYNEKRIAITYLKASNPPTASAAVDCSNSNQVVDM